jgi:hypothetical protein
MRAQDNECCCASLLPHVLHTRHVTLTALFASVCRYCIAANRYTGFSGTTLYDSYSMQLYNIIFTTPPILAVGAFDKDVSFAVMKRFPELYECGRKSLDLNNRKMATQLVFSIVHSFCIFGWCVVRLHGA